MGIRGAGVSIAGSDWASAGWDQAPIVKIETAIVEAIPCTSRR